MRACSVKFITSGLLPVNKPSGVSSYDVVRKIKKVLQPQKVGHLGTLDPLASGVLVILLNKATRLADLLHEDSKNYDFTVSLGTQTTTLDNEGEVIASSPVPDLTKSTILSTIQGFMGEQEQKAPVYSAIKYQGKPLYEYARKNRLDEIPDEVLKRTITVNNLDLRDFDKTSIQLSVNCSKGTYVRSLARDIALRLGTVGFASQIKRTSCANIKIEQCLDYDDISFESAESELISIDNVKCDALSTLNQEHKVMLQQGRLIDFQAYYSEKKLNTLQKFLLKHESQVFGIGEIKEKHDKSFLKMTRGL